MLNPNSLDGICAALAYAFGIDMEEDLNIVHLYRVYPKRV